MRSSPSLALGIWGLRAAHPSRVALPIIWVAGSASVADARPSLYLGLGFCVGSGRRRAVLATHGHEARAGPSTGETSLAIGQWAVGVQERRRAIFRLHYLGSKFACRASIVGV